MEPLGWRGGSSGHDWVRGQGAREAGGTWENELVLGLGLGLGLGLVISVCAMVAIVEREGGTDASTAAMGYAN